MINYEGRHLELGVSESGASLAVRGTFHVNTRLEHGAVPTQLLLLHFTRAPMECGTIRSVCVSLQQILRANQNKVLNT
jgi:hypothetical protein